MLDIRTHRHSDVREIMGTAFLGREDVAKCHPGRAQRVVGRIYIEMNKQEWVYRVAQQAAGILSASTDAEAAGMLNDDEVDALSEAEYERLSYAREYVESRSRQDGQATMTNQNKNIVMEFAGACQNSCF
jgi:hypothetical protein